MTVPTHFPLLLEQLTQELKNAALWQATAPDENKLSSQQPFALDTLAPHEWLQWIFIPRMWQLIEQQAPMPKGFLVTPYFVEVWKYQTDYQPMINLLAKMDSVVQQC